MILKQFRTTINFLFLTSLLFPLLFHNNLVSDK